MIKHVIAIFIIVILLITTIIPPVLALGYVKSHLEWACNFQSGLNMVLGKPFTGALCKNAGSNNGGTGGFNCGGGGGIEIDKDKLKSQLQSDEGLRLYPYKDTRGICTIGYGHNLVDGSNDVFKSATGGLESQSFISKCCPDAKSECSGAPKITSEQAKALFESDLSPIETDVATRIKSYNSLPGGVKQILVEMRFQLGGPGLSKFVAMIAALESSPPNFITAAQEMVDSDMYDQLNCSSSGQKLNRTQAKEQIDDLGSDGSCRTIKQAVRMRDTLCEVAVIPSGNPKGSGIIKNYTGTILTNSSIAELNFDQTFGDALLAAIKDGEQQNPPIKIVVFSGSGTTGHAPNSRHYRGMAADINTIGEPTCFQSIRRGGCSTEVVKIMNKYGLHNLCYAFKDYPNGDCNHFQF
jgi:GH24 family phage-related lysozyme (muramidase)